ncbi:MAG: T9SS type A sorting domain-containing protein [Flavobacteriaceae bacterium]
MKKITLLFVLTVMSMATQAQEIINREIEEEHTSIISTKGTDGGTYTADHFVIEEDVTLGNLDIMGAGTRDIDTEGLFSFADEVTAFNVYIFEDDNGVPAGDPKSGGELFKLEDISDAYYTLLVEDVLNLETAHGDFLGIDLTAANGGTEIVLEAGSYWISVFPTVSTITDGHGRWNWLESDAPVEHEAMIIDPDNASGSGASDWVNIASLIGEPWNAQAWILRDETALAVAGDFDLAEMVSVYPNPTSDFVQLNLPSDIEISSVQLFDLLGQKIAVEINNQKIDLSSYTDGVYMLNIKTNQGELTKKIIKK